MKQLIILAVVALALAITSHANAWTLRWDPAVVDDTHSAPDGYLVEMAPEVEEGAELVWTYKYNVAGDVTSLNLDDKIPYLKTFSFRVSAYNAAGVSTPCPAISWTRPGYIPPEDVTLPEVVAVDNIPPAIPTGLVAE